MGNRINYDYIEDYINGMTQRGSIFSASSRRYLLTELHDEARKQGLPVTRPQVEAFLRWHIGVTKPKNILEIGTCVGYSAITMLDAADEDARLTTIECEEELLTRARENFEKSGLSHRISSFLGDSGEIMPLMSGEYDFIFMDAAKGQYLSLMKECLRMLKPGGVIVCDDVLFYGMIGGDRSLLNPRKITIVKRMKVFLEKMMTDEALETLLLPIGDGICISRKKI
ncbi:MAG: O-methyltransferase [Clostridia bacterium]|nr:O-methyltransferase [Clostridia bacterium]